MKETTTRLKVGKDAFYCMKVFKIFSRKSVSCSIVSNSLTAWTVAYKAPLSMVFSRQEHWSGLPLPSPGDLPDPRTEPTSPVSPALAGGFFTTVPHGNL